MAFIGAAQTKASREADGLGPSIICFKDTACGCHRRLSADPSVQGCCATAACQRRKSDCLEPLVATVEAGGKMRVSVFLVASLTLLAFLTPALAEGQSDLNRCQFVGDLS